MSFFPLRTGSLRIHRSFWVGLHRYIGLVLASFLALAGLTGSVLAWHDELDQWISPELLMAAPPEPSAQALDPLWLRQRIQDEHPQAYVAVVPLALKPGQSLAFWLYPIPDPLTGATPELENNQIFVDPYTGHTLGQRSWGDITQGLKNLVPFVYRLHYALAIDVIGATLLGIVALLWTGDCFIGLILTWPLRLNSSRLAQKGVRAVAWWKQSWLVRWWPSWTVRWRGSAYKVNVDLHRAGGLWLWVMLLVFAWSGVAFNLPSSYAFVMKRVMAHQSHVDDLPLVQVPELQPQWDWFRALAHVRLLMAEQAQAKGFTVWHEQSLQHDPLKGIYRFDVKSSRDISDKKGQTHLIIDASTGELKNTWLPTGAASGDTLKTWITNLHMAALWGLPMKAFICLMGGAVLMLSVTGVVIWWKKRGAQRIHKNRHTSTVRVLNERMDLNPP